MKSVLLVLLLALASPVAAQTCIASSPTLAWQTVAGGPIGYAPGSMEQVNVVIKNTNSDGCLAAKFDVSVEPYTAATMSGWTFKTFDAGATALSGQVAVAAIQITSPQSAVPGTYTVKVTVTPHDTPSTAVSAYLGAVVIAPGTVCTTTAPRVTVTPSQMDNIAPGTSLTYTVGITNNNSPACVMSTFDLNVVTSPANWPTQFLGNNNTVSAGATGLVTLLVAVPPDAGGGSYAMNVYAEQHDAPLNVSMDSAVVNVKTAASLKVSASADKLSYKRGTAARITASVVSVQAGNAFPAADVIVTVQVTDPHLKIQTLKSVLTDATGHASVSVPILKTDARGSYRVTVSVMKPGVTAAQGVVVFTAQ